MSFPYKHVLLIGATSGIGQAMAEKLVAQGIHVTVAGRRKDRLDAFTQAHGPSKSSSIAVDISDIEKIPEFAENALKLFPSIDAVFLNAGMQRHYNFASPQSVSLATFNQEMTTNFTSFAALTHAFLPHLLSPSNPTAILFTGTHISLVPAATLVAYSASKAALDSFFVCVREQLKETNVNVIHISPPLVQSELHDFEMGAEVGRKMGIPASQFVEETWIELSKGEKDIYVGSIGGSTKEQFLEIAERRTAAFDRLCDLFRRFHAK